MTQDTHSVFNSFSNLKISESEKESLKLEKKEHHYSKEYESIDLALHQFSKKYKKFPQVKKNYVPSPLPKTNRLAFPYINNRGDIYYSTFKDPLYYKFTTSLFNDLAKKGTVEPRLLVNHCLLAPLIANFYPQEVYKKPDALHDFADFCTEFHPFMKEIRSRCSIDDIVIRMKKTTTPGWPNVDANGKIYTTKDVSYGFDFNFNDPLSRAKKDFSEIKRGYLPFLDKIWNDMKSVMGAPITHNNIVDYQSRCLVTVNRPGFRFNSIDKPINIEDHYDGKSTLYGKNRNYLVWGKDSFETGKLNVKKYAERFSGLFPQPYSPQRLRAINVSSWLTGVIHQIDAQKFLKPLEKSKFSFLSMDEKVVNRYNAFLSSTLGYEKKFLGSDRVNSEIFVTSNWNVFKNIFPDKDKYDLFSTHILYNDLQPRVTKGLLSGIGWTTGLNVIVGMYETCHQLSVLTNSDIKYVSNKYFSQILNQEDLLEIKGHFFHCFLPTDDIPIVIASKNMKELNFKQLENEAEGRMMEVEISDKNFQTFGMLVDESGIKPSGLSQIAKLFYFEEPGHANRDFFSVWARYNLLGDVEKEIVAKNLFDVYKTKMVEYEKRSGLFEREMMMYNVPIEEMFNEFSPKDRMLLGDRVGLDPSLSVSVVDPKFYNNIFEELQ